MSRLKKFTDAEAEGKEWPALLDNCLLWGKWDEILELITDWFPGPLQDQTDSPVQVRQSLKIDQLQVELYGVCVLCAYRRDVWVLLSQKHLTLSWRQSIFLVCSPCQIPETFS